MRKNKIAILSLAAFTLISLFTGVLALASFPLKDAMNEMKKFKSQKVYLKTKILVDGKAQYSLQNNKAPAAWVNISEIPRLVYLPIIVSEDWAFYSHKGVDFSQINEAFWDYAVHGKKLRGASTITQQLVKNLYLSNDRSAERKALEIFLALWMETQIGKKRILELYLNAIEFGFGIYGIKMACQHYFHKHPRDLNLKEGAFLAMLLPNPKKYSSSFHQKHLTRYAQKTVNRILHKMLMARLISPDALAHWVNTPYSWEIRTSSSIAPVAAATGASGSIIGTEEGVPKTAEEGQVAAEMRPAVGKSGRDEDQEEDEISDDAGDEIKLDFQDEKIKEKGN